MATVTPTQLTTSNIDVFISYNWKHQPLVRQIYKGLQNENITCWMDEKKMMGGDNLYGEIAGGLVTCKLVVACISKEYTESLNCTQEMKFAYDWKKAIIPVIVDKVAWPLMGELGFILAGRLYVNVSDSVDELEKWNGSKVDDLVKSVKEKLSAVVSSTLRRDDMLDSNFILYQSPPQKCVRLLIFYRSVEFSPDSCSNVYDKGQYPWSSFPHMKCSLPDMVPGLLPFSAVRTALNSVLINKCGNIQVIGQRCGVVIRNQVAEVTSHDEDDVEEDRDRRLFCSVDGTQYSWRDAGEPDKRRSVREGDDVIICGAQRRTVIVIRP